MNSSLRQSSDNFPLYDPQELLSMDSKVASGYLVLMGGYAATAGGAPKLDSGALNLAFMALIEGNVIEACFGIKSHAGAGASSERGMKIAKDAKSLINDAVQSSQAVKEIAVTAYGKAFQGVIDYNSDKKQLNFITRCWKSKPIRLKAESSLHEAFKPLNEAIAAAT